MFPEGSAPIYTEAFCSQLTRGVSQSFIPPRTVCECTTGSDSTSNVSASTLSCMDTECQSRNQVGTVCSINEPYQYTYDDTGHSLHFHSTFQYVVCRNATVTLDLTILPDFTLLCKVTVNGQVSNVYASMPFALTNFLASWWIVKMWRRLVLLMFTIRDMKTLRGR
jgi:hypothetical protein